MTGNTIQIINWLYAFEDKNKLFDIKEHKEKRSKSQNSYAWELIGKLADAMRISKEEMYLKMLKDYGQSERFKVDENVDVSSWFKYFEEEGSGYDGIMFYKVYRVYKGSSNFDTKEMTIFIDGIIQECSNLGIPTLTEEQIKSMRLV